MNGKFTQIVKTRMEETSRDHLPSNSHHCDYLKNHYIFIISIIDRFQEQNHWTCKEKLPVASRFILIHSEDKTSALT